MENTRENAAAFLKKCNEATFVAIPITPEGIMVAYAERVVASACSAPSSIGEEIKVTVSDEDIYKACPDFDIITKGDFNTLATTMMEEAFISGAKWAISRLSERKIVLPSDEDMRSMYLKMGMNGSFDQIWNACLSEIKRLNGINK